MHPDQSNVARDGRNTRSSSIEVSFVADRTGDIVELSACRLSDLIASHKVSYVEVAAAYLDQIGHVNPTYNAIVSLREREDILADAREKDELLARGIRQGWLHGFPLAIKDLAPTKGLRTTLGSPLHRDWVPNRDAQFVKQMKQSGAVLIGKTNTTEFGLGSYSTRCSARRRGPSDRPADFRKAALGSGLAQLAHAYEQATRWTSIRPLEAVSMGGDVNGCPCA